MKLRIALGQMDIAFGDLPANLESARRMAAESAAQGADLLLLPELWSSGYDLENAGRHASAVNEGIFAQTAALAREYRVHIAGSCLARLESGGIGNTAVVFNPRGEILGVYSKIHLFGPMQEDRYLSPGSQPVTLEPDWGKTGLAICYDLRFPELFRAYAAGGVKVALIPAEWPTARIGHWQTLLRARAIENQMVVAACNRVGSDPANAFGGHSCVLDPWGESLLETGAAEGVWTVEVDVEEVDRVREKYPFLRDRRLL
jgi:omega-amidase